MHDIPSVLILKTTVSKREKMNERKNERLGVFPK